MKLYLIRHAKSISNEKKLVTGDIFDKLSEVGISQAINLKGLLKISNIEADCYYVSQWDRAKETAMIVKPNIIWQEDISLGETNAGSVKNEYLNDFKKSYPNFYKSNTNNYPNGESHQELYTRVISWFDNILKEKDTNTKVMMVTHSGPISCILQYINKISIEQFPCYLPSNASITIVDIPNNNISNARIEIFSYLPLENFINEFGN